MKIQCLIERDGVTTTSHNGVRLDFVPNEHGDYVCDVFSQGTIDYLLNTFCGENYRVYAEPETIELVKPERQLATEFYESLKTKREVEEACLQDFGVDLSRRLSLKNMKKKVFALIEKEL